MHEGADGRIAARRPVHDADQDEAAELTADRYQALVWELPYGNYPA